MAVACFARKVSIEVVIFQSLLPLAFLVQKGTTSLRKEVHPAYLVYQEGTTTKLIKLVVLNALSITLRPRLV
jgi:hypothetical protein